MEVFIKYLRFLLDISDKASRKAYIEESDIAAINLELELMKARIAEKDFPEMARLSPIPAAHVDQKIGDILAWIFFFKYKLLLNILGKDRRRHEERLDRIREFRNRLSSVLFIYKGS